MNEHQLAMGESTCAARFWAAPPSAGGNARMEVREMSKIALERCKTARCAISLMGELGEKYGMYAADWSGGDASLGEAGEALTVIDTEEAWVFHVLSDDKGTGAVWAAQRVPDNHVSNFFFFCSYQFYLTLIFIFPMRIRAMTKQADSRR
jgi:dipeptidase